MYQTANNAFKHAYAMVTLTYLTRSDTWDMNAEIDDTSELGSGTGCDDSSLPSDDATPGCVEGTGAEFEDFLAVT